MELTVLREKLLRGSIVAGARIVMAIPVYIILTPFTLNKLGADLFGIWSFSTIVISLLNLTDFGLKNSLVYHIARDATNFRRVNAYFNVTFWTYLLTCSTMCVFVVFFAETVAGKILSVPAHLHDETVFVVLITALSFGLRMLAIPFQSVLEGHQEVSPSQLILLAWLVIYFIGTLVVLTFKPDIYALGAVTLASNLFILVAFYLAVNNRYPHIGLNLNCVDRSRIREMFKYGVGIQTAYIFIALREPMYKILIARAYDLSSLATFEIAYKLSTQAMSLVTTPLLGVLGATALLIHRQSDLQKMLKPLTACTVGLILPSTLLVLSFSDPLVRFWLGPNELAVGHMLPLVFTTFGIYYLTEALYKAIEGSGLSKYGALVQAAVLFVNMASFALLVPYRNGAVPLSLLSGFLLFSVCNYLMFKRRFDEIRLFNISQTIALCWPSCAYASLILLASNEILAFLYIGYLVLHVWSLKRAGIFDFLGQTRELLKQRNCAFSQ